MRPQDTEATEQNVGYVPYIERSSRMAQVGRREVSQRLAGHDGRPIGEPSSWGDFQSLSVNSLPSLRAA